MLRSSLILAALCGFATHVQAGDEPGRKQTIAYVQGLQTSTGGFLSMAPKPNIKVAPTLRATSAGVRALHYLNAKVPQADACAKYVDSCFDAASGGFADMPKGKPDLFTTAVGIMAVTELKMPVEKYGPGITKYLTEQAQSFEDIRIAAAGLERVQGKSPKNAEWLKEVAKLMNKDGTFGKDAGHARDTGGSAVVMLRLGGELPNRDNVLKAIRDGQRQNGGYGKADNELASDLETTYRVMRCFMMLKAQPASVEGVRSFVAKCRNEDGGYGVAPGEASTVNATYFAIIILHWLNEK